MKKILLIVLVFISVAYADLFKEGMNAYNHGDYQKAEKLFKKASEQGDAKAQYTLGLMYDDGQGVRQDYSKAVKWYRKAADQGYADAQLILGLMYQDGKGVRQNLSEAKSLFGKACDNGLQDGCRGYKILNERGIQ